MELFLIGFWVIVFFMVMLMRDSVSRIPKSGERQPHASEKFVGLAWNHGIRSPEEFAAWWDIMGPMPYDPKNPWYVSKQAEYAAGIVKQQRLPLYKDM